MSTPRLYVKNVKLPGFRWTCPECGQVLEYLNRYQLENNATVHLNGHQAAAKRRSEAPKEGRAAERKELTVAA